MHLPYLTTDFPGIGGQLKARDEDFFVQEIPAYEPSGEGEHVYCEIQKVGLTSFEAMDRIAKALFISPRDIGYAGMKDARAVTRQVISILGTTPDDVMALKLSKIQILWASRHGNKLRLGHLAGNRFAVKIREVEPTDVVKLTPIVRSLEKTGFPNFFGEQRFGHRGDNHLLGAALVRGDNVSVLKLLLGSPNPDIDPPDVLQARTEFDKRDNENAIKHYPRHCGLERRILSRLMKTAHAGSAVRAVDEKIKRLWISALQSHLFNEVAARRIATLGTLLKGDFAYKHENHACFLVEDPALEQPRADAFEISPTGPLLGYRMTFPAGDALPIEQEVFDKAGLKGDDFRQNGKLRVKGMRRPLRVCPTDITLAGGVDEHGPHITVAFALPAGSFATVFLRELMKSDDKVEAAEAESEEDNEEAAVE